MKDRHTIQGKRQTCDVCYDDFLTSAMYALGCGHYFCNGCIGENMKALLEAGKVTRLRCMQQGCTQVYTIKEVEKFCTPKEAELYLKINKDVQVGKNKNLRWCSNIDCDNVVRRSRCPCKSKAVCECGQAMCFECGEAWHTGSCKNGVDNNYAKFMLLATCPKCKAPVEKNGACNMMSCRCGAGFCWICRQDVNHNYDHFRLR